MQLTQQVQGSKSAEGEPIREVRGVDVALDALDRARQGARQSKEYDGDPH